MAGTELADVGLHDVLANEMRQVRMVDPIAVGVEEENGVVDGAHELRPCLLDVLLDPAERPLADRHDTLLAALATTHPKRSSLGVEVVEGHMHKLQAADAGAVEDFEDGSIT